jgi:hypothetical protein
MASASPFPGIDPFVNSYLQSDTGPWESFHSTHIIHLNDELEIQLPQGYASLSEESLQIRRTVLPEEFNLPPVSFRPDVILSRPSSLQSTAHSSPLPASPTETVPLVEFQEDVETMTAVIIYKIVGKNIPGKPITRIELLSPANKPNGSHHETYLHNRRESLRAGLNLVEIDYLHETQPIFLSIPSYRKRAKGAFPYRIIVSNPHPSYAQGVAQIYAFGVDAAIPVIPIPLEGEETLAFDFGFPYKRTISSRRTFQDEKDYTKLPQNFERYTPEDQALMRKLIGHRQE